MGRTVTKQVRLTPAETKRLSKVAKATGRSESDILRMGIDAAEEKAELLKRRRIAIEGLIRMAKEVPGENIPFGLK